MAFGLQECDLGPRTPEPASSFHKTWLYWPALNIISLHSGLQRSKIVLPIPAINMIIPAINMPILHVLVVWATISLSCRFFGYYP